MKQTFPSTVVAYKSDILECSPPNITEICMQTLTNTASVAHLPTETKRDVSISLGAANLYFLPALALALLLLLPFTALYGWASVQEGLRVFFDGLSFLAVFLLGIIIHETLHGISLMIAGKISPQNIRYGVK